MKMPSKNVCPPEVGGGDRPIALLDLLVVPISDVVCKCVCWPLYICDSLVTNDRTFLMLPLLH